MSQHKGIRDLELDEIHKMNREIFNNPENSEKWETFNDQFKSLKQMTRCNCIRLANGYNGNYEVQLLKVIDDTTI